jgi:hypothetical protein
MLPPEETVQDRPLTEKETEITKWLLEHGSSDSRHYLDQLKTAWVIARCPCGCASVDFSVNGTVQEKSAGIEVLSEYNWGEGEGLCGIFVFARDGQLSGLEVWSIDGIVDAPRLPAVSELRK